MKFSKEPLRGMKDFYPADLREYKYIYAVIEDIADLYGYEEYEGPIFENLELFTPGAPPSASTTSPESSAIVHRPVAFA